MSGGRDVSRVAVHAREWVDAIKQAGVNLSVWEEQFVESVDVQLAAGLTLSERQAEILERIYAERTP